MLCTALRRVALCYVALCLYAMLRWRAAGGQWYCCYCAAIDSFAPRRGKGEGGGDRGASARGLESRGREKRCFFSFSSFFFLLSKKAKRDDGLQCIDYEDYLTYEQCTGPGQSRPNPTIPSVGWSPTGRFGRLGQRPFLTPNYLFDAYRVQYSPSFLRRRGRWGFKSS